MKDKLLLACCLLHVHVQGTGSQEQHAVFGVPHRVLDTLNVGGSCERGYAAGLELLCHTQWSCCLCTAWPTYSLGQHHYLLLFNMTSRT